MNENVGNSVEDNLLTIFCLLQGEKRAGELVLLAFGNLQEDRGLIAVVEGEAS